MQRQIAAEAAYSHAAESLRQAEVALRRIDEDPSARCVAIQEEIEEISKDYWKKEIDEKKVFPIEYYLIFDEYSGARFHYTANVKNPSGIYLSNEPLKDGTIDSKKIAEQIYDQIASYKVLSHLDQGILQIKTPQ